MNEHTAESDAAVYTDPRCGCTSEDALHRVTCASWPLAVAAPIPPVVDNSKVPYEQPIPAPQTYVIPPEVPGA